MSTYCVYFGNGAAPDVSNETAVFSPTTAQTTSYYTMLNTYNNTPLQVVSYVAGNTVSDGTTTVVLGVGGTHTFNGTNRNTVITATGPIEGSADVNGTETILPESFAHNEFVFPVTRGSNGAWVRSPFGPTTIDAIVNGAVVNSVAITPAMGSVWLAGDFASDDTLIVRSTDGTDFLVELVGDETVTTGVSLVSGSAPASEPVLRIYQGHPGPWQGTVQYGDGANLSAITATINTDHPSTQVTVAGGIPSSPSPAFSHTTAEPYSVLIDHSITPGQTSEVDVDLTDIGLVKLETRVRFTFIG